MTAPLDMLLSFVLAGAVALACRVQLRLSPRPWYATRYFASLATFEGLVVLPTASYRYFFYPDWSAMYFIDTANARPLFAVAGLLLVALSGTAAFVLGNYCSRSRREWLLLAALALAVAGVALVSVMGADRIMAVGSFSQWERTYGLRRMTQTDLLPAVLGMGFCVLAAWIHMLVLFAREGTAMTHASR